MSIPNRLALVLLITEIIVFLILVLPMPRSVRKTITKFITQSWIVTKLVTAFRWTFIFLTLLFIDSFTRQYKMTQERAEAIEEGHYHHQHGNLGIITGDLDPRAKLYYAQRNMYMTGFALFLMVVLDRYRAVLLELVRSEEQVAELTVQYASHKRQLRTLLDERDAGAAPSTPAAATVVSDDVEEIVRKRVAEETKKVKEQADANFAQYLELSDRYNELEGKFDRLREKRADVVVQDE
ncbi:hypothetical protein AMAG_11807 [Allomyces macrogynus ATCC 38327]|uniref:Endoplasmic reticulum transmembrane protein n=1 Tax=Allomyces macrogynus (strain ATCC 38327) TaxID=578462 RepID=A0A0L0SXV2_ALLM3|nr:hypothetical protein AMAG_11807 [Allomyces macrogynus ATCC 38327]|eukprot:KNE67337.1 hypothetical protein AMAG_11807 [Allomyces macrogynus ATCC 38327]